MPRPARIGPARALAVVAVLAFSATAVLPTDAPRPRPAPDRGPGDATSPATPVTTPMARPDPAPPPGPPPDAADAPAAAVGPVCGNPAILGTTVPTIGDTGECGILHPVALTSVAGVALEPGPTLGCRAATTLHAWLEEAAKPAFAADGAPLTGLDVAADYICRNVNYAADGELSEHAHGRAIDISAFRRADGSRVTVLDGWGSDEHGALLAEIHDAACGRFTTALGPDSDALHADHVHYDVADRRRPYCP
jgi:hypothetical protein